MKSAQEGLKKLDQTIKKDFESNKRILSFDEYIQLLAETPDTQLRGTAKYCIDMMDFFGRTENPDGSFHFNVFDQKNLDSKRKVIGQRVVQIALYESLLKFHRQKINNKLLLLHGPNGSSKTSIVHALMAGMEEYSHTPKGALYSFNWIFPHEKITKSGIGFSSSPSRPDTTASYAKIAEDEIASVISSELKDHPILLIPQQLRLNFLVYLLGDTKAQTLFDSLPNYLRQGDLSHRDRQIFDALLGSYHGDLKKVLQHIQIDRVYLSRRYRAGLVTIEPQMHVDAQYQLLTMNKSIANLPAALQGINLFTLTGDLIEGNRGMIEFSDLLKRPLDTFKYLLVTCESGAVNIGQTIAYLDSLFIGSTNELQLDGFKEFPDFMSFKARIELIRVPYLLEISKEQKIYDLELQSLKNEKDVAPHTSWTIAAWAVLSRLKKPNSVNFPADVSHIVSNLTPLDKAKLLDGGEMPNGLSPDDRKLLKSAIRKIREEYDNVPYYEGRMGASAREMKSLLFDALQNREFATLSPIAVLRELDEFVKRTSEYDFLKQDIKDGYHDCAAFVQTVRSEYLNRVDKEVRDAVGLYDSEQWESFLKSYIEHISVLLKKDKVKNAITGKMEDPNLDLIEEFEKIVEAPTESSNLETFRQNVISQVGAWSLDHPKEALVYSKVFSDFWRRIERHYYESQKALLTKMHDALLLFGQQEHTLDPSDEGAKLATRTIANLAKKYGYTENSAREVLAFLMQSRY